MPRRRITRRRLLASTLGLALPVRFSWAAPAPSPSPDPGAKLLGPERWAALARLANHFLPGIAPGAAPARSPRAARFTGTLPSATDLGVLDYLARALDGPYRPHLEDYRTVLDAIAKSADDAALAATLEKLAKTAAPALSTIRGHVLEGCFALPVHGGNRKESGWKMVGLTRHQHADE